MAERWYIARNKQKYGPYSSDQLRQSAASGKLRPDDMVLKDGTSKWVAASAIFFPPPPSGGFSAPLAAPTAVSPKATSATPSSGSKAVCPVRAKAATPSASPPPAETWWREIREIGLATWGQTWRCVIYVKEAWRGRSIRRAAAAAQFALGERINAQKAGDRQIQAQIAALDENIRQAEATKKSTSSLKAERKVLILQLAAPSLGKRVALPATEAEHQKAAELKAAIERHKDGMKTIRTSLLPHDIAGWRRVGIGYGIVCFFCIIPALGFLCVLTLGSMLGGSGKHSTRAASSGLTITLPGEGEPKIDKFLLIDKPSQAFGGGQQGNSPKTLLFSPKGETLFAVTGNHESKFFDLNKRQEQAANAVEIRSSSCDDGFLARWLSKEVYSAHCQNMNKLCMKYYLGFGNGEQAFLSPDGGVMATGFKLLLMDTTTGQEIKLQTKPEDLVRDSARRSQDYPINALTFSPNSKLLAVWGRSGLKVWELSTGKEVAHLSRKPAKAVASGLKESILFSPEGQTLAANQPNNQSWTATLWDCTTWQEQSTLKVEGSAYYRMRSFSPNGSLLVTTHGKRVSLWDVRTGDMLHEFEGKDMKSVAFTPDGQYLVAGGFNPSTEDTSLRRVDIWNVTTRKLHAQIEDKLITVVAVAPDGRHVATGNAANGIKLWDMTQGRLVELPRQVSGDGTSAERPIQITAMQLYSEYQKNKSVSESRYKGRWLSVWGEVTLRDDSPQNHPGTILMGLRGSLAKNEYVSCYFDRKHEIQLQRLNKSPQPPVIGRCVGLFPSEYGKPGSSLMEVQLIDCTIPGEPGEKLETPIPKGPAPSISDELYNKIRNGMTIYDVQKLCGGEPYNSVVKGYTKEERIMRNSTMFMTNHYTSVVQFYYSKDHPDSYFVLHFDGSTTAPTPLVSKEMRKR